MKHLILTFILLFGVFSCTPKNYEKPKNLIGKSDLIEILTDLYISQQGLQMYPPASQNDNTTITLAKDAVNILNKHNVTTYDFQESYKYYAMQPEDFNKMLNKVKKNLEEKFSEEEKERQKNQKNHLEESQDKQ